MSVACFSSVVSIVLMLSSLSECSCVTLTPCPLQRIFPQTLWMWYFYLSVSSGNISTIVY